MDRVGTYMCLATIPMAILSLASIAAGPLLLALGDWRLVVEGVLAFALCLIFAQMLEWLIVRLDDIAAITLDRRRRTQANVVAAVSGGLPVIVILAWEILCFSHFDRSRTGLGFLLAWLWCYGLATGPWTAYAMRVSRFRRTLVGIRAYAGHLAFWLLSILSLLLWLPTTVAALAMLVPAILPFVVGMLLAVADREALTNVRV